ncbi:MAG: hypothetical protein CBB68_09405 [Rhodospirillaceae bacterium TMED8]|nr:hypothetical protein [Magnetovibrio sp.]OUT50079.1 MAG: hypothetical protein CBB68_09405 [Rhodospirillaceae bacterium TMED8]
MEGQINSKVWGCGKIGQFESLAKSIGRQAVDLDMRVTQLLCSRLCHDIVGSASAFNTGVEFIEEAPSTEVIDLLKSSADRLTRRLDFFRVALGFGGGRHGVLTLLEASKLAQGWFLDAKPNLHWTPETTAAGDNGVLQVSGIKMLMLMTLLGEECLARGGVVEVHVLSLEEGLGVAVSANGPSAKLPDDLAAGLNPNCPAETVTARNVHAYWAQKIAHAQQAFLEAEALNEEVRFAVLIP